MADVNEQDKKYLAVAYEEAEAGYKEGGVPIGAALVSADGKLLGRVTICVCRRAVPLYMLKISALENSGRLPASAYRGATMYTTLSPCDMCTGSCILYKIARVVIGENETFMGERKYLKERGVEVVVLKDDKCRELMQKFVKEQPDIWNEDIGSR